MAAFCAYFPDSDSVSPGSNPGSPANLPIFRHLSEPVNRGFRRRARPPSSGVVIDWAGLFRQDKHEKRCQAGNRQRERLNPSRRLSEAGQVPFQGNSAKHLRNERVHAKERTRGNGARKHDPTQPLPRVRQRDQCSAGKSGGYEPEPFQRCGGRSSDQLIEDRCTQASGNKIRDQKKTHIAGDPSGRSACHGTPAGRKSFGK